LTLRLKLFLIFTFICLSTAYVVASDNAAIVLDVSGSMKNYGAWQIDAREALSSILTGQRLPNHWQLTPRTTDLTSFASGPQGRVTFIRFGGVRATAEYPFFDGMRNSLTLSEFAEQFPTKASDYTQNRTNNALAESVAVRETSDTSGTARVIMISDFLADATPSEKQLAFINEIQSGYAKYTVATLSWEENPRVQIKLLKFVAVSSPPGKEGTEELGSLHLSPARYDGHTQAVYLSWNYHGPTPAEKYGLKVVDARHGNLLFTKQNLAGGGATYPKVAPGPIRWSVTAYLPDGRTVEQSATYNIPDAGGSPFAWLLLIIVLVALLGTGIFLLKKYGLPDFLKKLKSRPDIDF
jgi:hypothetical protein